MTTIQSPPFSELLRRYRRAASLTQEELAEQAGLSARVVSDLERGLTHRPRKDTFQLLAAALGLTEEEREDFRRAARQIGDPRLAVGEQAPLTYRTTLSHEPRPFIGRQQEMAALSQLLGRPDHRLVTLTGPGGSGKTRLALEIASAHLTAFADGVYFVSLAPLTDPNLVAPTMAVTLGITDGGEHAVLEKLTQTLQDKHLLLVLDNFEHLLGAAPLVGDLLRSCPSLQVLVTSRAILRLSMEREFPVPPLSLPPLTLVPDLAAPAQADAAALFVDRAQAARPDFVLTQENAPYVAAICHRLDGLPLALELAAARIRVLPPPALLGRLARRFDLLTGGARDRPTRQQTLRDTIDWSYSLLSPEEQTLFARLSVFVGGWTLEAAEAVCNTEGDLAVGVLDGIASLVEQSLVRQEGERESRFGMLETIREYAAEKLEERGEVQEIQRHHALYFLEFAEGIRPELDGPGQIKGLDRLEEEHNNLRAAVEWACDQREIEVGLRLAIASEYLYMRGYRAEMGGWFETLLAVQASVGKRMNPSVLAEALQLAASYASSWQGNAQRTRTLTEESIALIDDLADPREIAYRLQCAGQLLGEQGEHARAIAVLEQALSLFRKLDDKAGMGAALMDLGGIALEQGDAKRVIELCEESLRLNREVGNRPYVARALHSLGVAARMLGDLDRARVLHEEALDLNPHIGMREEMLASLAAVVRDLGDLAEAETLLAEALRGCLAGGRHVAWTATSLEGMAGLAAVRGRTERAAALFGAAHALRERLGWSILPVDRPVYDGDLASVRESLGAEQFAKLWDGGRAMTVDQAIAYALDETPGRSAMVR